MNIKENMNEKFVDVIEKNNLEVSYKWISDSLYSAFYSIEKKCIYLCDELLCEAYNEVKKRNNIDFSYEKYIEIVFMHEIGHALDKELIKLNKQYDNWWIKYIEKKVSKEEYQEKTDQIILKREENAWNIAQEKYEKGYQDNIFGIIKRDSMKEYVEFLKNFHQWE